MQETRIQSALDDVASNIHQTQPRGGVAGTAGDGGSNTDDDVVVIVAVLTRAGFL